MNDAKGLGEAGAELRTFGRERLLPGAYGLDLSPVFRAPLKLNGEPSSFGEVYLKLKELRIEEVADGSAFFSDKYITSEGEIDVSTDSSGWALSHTMRKLVELTRQGIDPEDVTWFYYDDDSSSHMDERHVFFAVYGDKVVIEQCSFSSEEPKILKKQEVDDDPIWRSHPNFGEALEIYWYRKFYTGTLMGQLMVLRPDEPILYHYQRPQVRDAIGEIHLLTVAKVYRLMMVAISLLVALAFPSIIDYAGIAAAALGVEFLLLCWRTRKVGRE